MNLKEEIRKNMFIDGEGDSFCFLASKKVRCANDCPFYFMFNENEHLCDDLDLYYDKLTKEQKEKIKEKYIEWKLIGNI